MFGRSLPCAVVVDGGIAVAMPEPDVPATWALTVFDPGSAAAAADRTLQAKGIGVVSRTFRFDLPIVTDPDGLTQFASGLRMMGSPSSRWLGSRRPCCVGGDGARWTRELPYHLLVGRAPWPGVRLSRCGDRGSSFRDRASVRSPMAPWPARIRGVPAASGKGPHTSVIIDIRAIPFATATTTSCGPPSVDVFSATTRGGHCKEGDSPHRYYHAAVSSFVSRWRARLEGGRRGLARPRRR